MENLNVLPFPTPGDSAQILPPCFSISLLHIDSPNPELCSCLDGSALKNSSKIFTTKSGLIPIPVSFTMIVTKLASDVASNSISFLLSMNLIEFEIKLLITHRFEATERSAFGAKLRQIVINFIYLENFRREILICG